MKPKAWILAVLAGLVATLAFATLVSEATMTSYIQEAVAYVLPRAVADSAYAMLVDGLVLAGRVLPGIAVAVLVVALWRSRGDGHTRCGSCGHILKGLSELRCPE